MSYIIQKDKKKRISFFKLEGQYLVAKTVSHNRCDSPFPVTKLYSFFKHSFSHVTIKNRCVYSGRPRAVYRFTKSSRINFRRLASSGALNGVRKASW